VLVTEIVGRIGGDEDVGFSFDRRQEAIAFAAARHCLAALPRYVVIAFAFRSELQLRRAFSVGLYGLRQNVVVLIAAKLQPPGFLSFVYGWRKRYGLVAQEAQLVALHFAASRIEPDFPPVVARDFNNTFGSYRLLVGVEGFDINGDFVFRTIDVFFRSRIDVVTLTRDPHRVAGNDLATGRVSYPGFNAIFE